MRWVKPLVWLSLLSVVVVGLFFWLRDEPEAPQVRLWLDKVQARSTPNRAYLFLSGLDAAPRTSPLALGESRLREYQDWLASHEPGEPRVSTPAAGGLPLPEGASFCLIEAARCFDSLLLQRAQLADLLTEHAALLSRYRYFLRLRGFRSSAVPGPGEPRLPLAYLVRGQQLMGLQALQLALRGDGSAALALLQEEQAGIRQKLVRVDQLELKMTLVSLLSRNLEWLVRLRRAGLLSPAAVELAPLSVEERSLRLPLQREFASTAAAWRELREENVPLLLEEASLLFEYKPQQTINAGFSLYQPMIRLSELTPAQFQERLKQRSVARAVTYTGLRNRIGNALLDMTGTEFIEQVGHIQDLDSKLKLASFSLRLGPGVVDSAQVSSQALSGGAGNPYVAMQLPYLDDQQRLCFHGPLPSQEGGRCVRL
ncbi:hypothetical protein A9179_00195 [Pseudomonas alcaligenes]|uniref:Uncharacterized protein n=1 Tax=Aquipseudomonas alcaligenes TaxID=43263 RepID=A0ABR7RWY7_AQUAC|nr:hypothetical protein [Pseudomonas alcaligenes]MBC9248683.1 hypothetical protein [Pseudomonas alcaligenes]